MDCKMPAKDIVMKFFNDHNYSQKFSLNVGISFLCVCECLGNEDYWLTILEKCTTDSISRYIALENNWLYWIEIMKCNCICNMKLCLSERLFIGGTPGKVDFLLVKGSQCSCDIGQSWYVCTKVIAHTQSVTAFAT